jgi:acyl carrier protein
VSTSILERIARVAADTFNYNPSKITERTVAYDIGGWDSLSHVYFIMGIEREFGLKLPLPEVMQLENVGALINLVQHCLEAPKQ